MIALSYGKRALAVVSVVATLYFCIGSLIYGEWFYGLFWDRKLWELSYWLDGLFFLFDEHTYSVILVAFGALLLAAVTSKYRERIWPLVDKAWLWSLGLSFVAIFAAALLVYRFDKEPYGGQVGLEAALASMDRVFRTIGKSDHLRTIEPPIDFDYLDQQRVNSLYSELIPEMEESERKVSTRKSVAGKAGASGGPISGEVGISKEAETESELKRTQYTPERKCVEVMRFIVSRDQGKYYTSSSTWFMDHIFREVRDAYAKAASEPAKNDVTKEDWEKLKEPPTKEQEQEGKRRAETYSLEFKSEMQSLMGLVIVDGVFSMRQSAQDSTILSEAYSEKSPHIVFRATVPTTSELSKMLPQGSTHLKVFGAVIKPLGKDGVIELRPIAIF